MIFRILNFNGDQDVFKFYRLGRLFQIFVPLVRVDWNFLMMALLKGFLLIFIFWDWSLMGVFLCFCWNSSMILAFMKLFKFYPLRFQKPFLMLSYLP